MPFLKIEFIILFYFNEKQFLINVKMCDVRLTEHYEIIYNIDLYTSIKHI